MSTIAGILPERCGKASPTLAVRQATAHRYRRENVPHQLIHQTVGWKIAGEWYRLGASQEKRLVAEIIVKILSKYLKRLISGDDVTGSNPASLRNIVVWVFIALVATFLTQPSGDARSRFDAPVPWPAELGLDNPGI
jgi:hypothetical protein